MATALDPSSPEYATLEEMLYDLVDNLAANDSVIDPLSNHLLSFELISEAVLNTVHHPGPGATPYDRCSNMLTPVLEKVESNPACFYLLIDSLEKVELDDIAFELVEKLLTKQELEENENDSDYIIDFTEGYYTESSTSDDEGYMESSSATSSTPHDEVLHSLPFPFGQLPPGQSKENEKDSKLDDEIDLTLKSSTSGANATSSTSDGEVSHSIPFPLVHIPPTLTYAMIDKMLEKSNSGVGRVSNDNDTQSKLSALQQFREQFSFFKKFLKKKSIKVNDELQISKNPKYSHLNQEELLCSFESGEYKLALSSLISFTDSEYLKTVSSRTTKFNKASLLHLAAYWGWIDIVDKLINDYGFDPKSSINMDGHTALHYAVRGRQFQAFSVLVTKHHCDPTYKNLEGEPPFLFAVKAGCFDIVAHYIAGLGYDGNTIFNGKPLGIIAAEHGHLNILKYLKEECHFDINKTCSKNNTALDYAARSGHQRIVMYLISECKCNPSQEKDWYSMKPLHHASEKGHIRIVRYLISNCNCNVYDTAKGLSPLQYAAENGHFELVKYFVLESNCNPEPALRHAGSLEVIKFLSKKIDKNPDYHIFLANAIRGKHIDAVRYLVDKWGKDTDLSDQLFEATCKHNFQVVEFLINDCHVNPTNIHRNGRSLLHYAAEGIYTNNGLLVVQCLLAAGLDPLKEDNNGDTPLDITMRSKNWKATKRFFDTFEKTKTMYPVESYVNVLIVGNSGAGKSTLSKVIEKTQNDSFKETRYISHKEVEPLTAGIVPITLDHKQLKNIVLHDFAGHSEYHLSHTAVIENILQGSAAVFIIVVDVSKHDYLIHFKQWLSVVRNEIKKAKDNCKVIVVASHFDRLSSKAGKDKVIESLQLELKSKDDIEFLDCRKLGGERLDSFFLKLQNACTYIRNNDKRSLTLYCHMMYNLLRNSEKEVLTLNDIASEILQKRSFFLPFDGKQILNILSSLHSTGLIYYLNCSNDLKIDLLLMDLDFDTFEASGKVYIGCKVWVVKNKMKFLKYVNGIIFSPKMFKENPNIKENGIVTVPFLKSIFPEDDLIMIISFLESMGLCHVVSPLFLLQTNLLKERNEINENDTHCLFFPSLVEFKRPPNNDSFCFGWFLECTDDHQWFSQRFFNSLILHLTLKHCLEEAASTTYNIYQCSYWKNGVKWSDENGIVTSVELVNDNRCVLILMSCHKKSYDSMISLRRNIIRDVLTTCKEYCPTLKVEAFVIDSDCLKEYPIEKPRETIAYCVKNMRNRKKDSHVNPTYPISKIKRGKRVCDILPYEPNYDNLSIFGKAYIKQDCGPRTSQINGDKKELTGASKEIMASQEYIIEIALEVLSKNITLIAKSIKMDHLAKKMMERNIITSDTLNAIVNDRKSGLTESERMSQLLQELIKTVEFSGEIFSWLIQTLKDYNTVPSQKMAGILEEQYKEMYLSK